MNDLVIADPAVADAYLIFVNFSILFWLVFPRLKPSILTVESTEKTVSYNEN